MNDPPSPADLRDRERAVQLSMELARIVKGWQSTFETDDMKRYADGVWLELREMQGHHADMAAYIKKRIPPP